MGYLLNTGYSLPMKIYCLIYFPTLICSSLTLIQWNVVKKCWNYLISVVARNPLIVEEPFPSDVVALRAARQRHGVPYMAHGRGGVLVDARQSVNEGA